jgi:ankyrin repeat protein
MQKLDAISQAASNQTRLVQHYTNQSQAVIRTEFQAFQMSISDRSSAHHQAVCTDLLAVRNTSTTTSQAVARMENQMGQGFSMMARLIADAQQPVQNSMPRRDDGSAVRIPRSTYESEFRPNTLPAMLHSIFYMSLALWGSRCADDCSCRCHMPTHRDLSLGSPRALHGALGSLFVGYTGSPVSSSRCDVEKCSKGRHVRLAFRYVFPLWFLSYAICGFIEASATGPLTMGLVAYRRVESFMSPDDLLHSVNNGQVNDVRRILRTNRASILDVRHADGRSALTIALFSTATWRATVEIIQSLLLAGADPDLEDDSKITPRQELARIALVGDVPPEFGAKLELMLPLSKGVDSLNLTFLHKVATGLCDVELAKTLQSGSREILDQVNARDQNGLTPLMYAARHGDVARARALVDAGAAVNEQSNDGFTPLMYAARASCRTGSRGPELVDLLLEAGADVNMVRRGGSTVLHKAAQVNNPDVIGRLVKAGAKVDRPDRDGDTPLFIATIYKSTEALELLHEQGADINATNSEGDTPILKAVIHNSHEPLSLLVRLGANHLAVHKSGMTLLHLAARCGDQTTLEMLASFNLKGIDIDARDSYEDTALEEFQDRSPVSDDLTSAFHRLLESLDTTSEASSQTDNELDSDELDSDVEDQEFVDAPEGM